MRKKQANDYHALAKERGFRWLSTQVPRNTKTPTSWTCYLKHQWKASYDNIRAGSGCPFCSGQARKTEKDYHALAKDRGIQWLGKELPSNTHHNTLWQCPNGHRWMAQYGSIQQGGGCPVCDDLSRRR